MKRLLVAAGLLLCAVLAQAQTGSPPGVPASALSITPRNSTPGVPPSVTSYSAFHPPPGFNAFNPPTIVGIDSLRIPRRREDFGRDRRRRGHFRPHGFGYGYGYAVPYAYAYPTYAEPEPEPEPQPQPAVDQPSGNAIDRELWSRAAEREDRSIDRRDVRTQDDEARSGDDRDTRRTPEREAAAILPEQPETALVLVLKDGSRMELGNYAIMGQTIYDLGHRGKKIQLAQLDVAATQKANDALGLEFKLPGR